MTVRVLACAAVLLSSGAAWASAESRPGLALQAERPPTAIGPSGHPSATRFRFPTASGVVDLDVLPAVVLHLAAGTQPPVAGARSLGGRSWWVPSHSAAEAIELALKLDALPGVSAFPDIQRPVQRTTDDPARSGQWYLDDLGMDELHAHSLGDPSVRVAVIDSGIDHQHPDLVDKVVAPFDAFSGDDDPSPDPGEFCYGDSAGSSDICDEHGTAVAGVSVASANNGIGIAGMCPECSLVPIKLLGAGSGSLATEIEAFEHAIAADAAVINNSWGYTARVPVPVTLAEVIERAAVEPRDGLGAVVVFAAGNDNREVGAEEMQALPSVLCVSATDSYLYPTNYTNFGDPIDVAAPSATVSITPIGELTTNFGGTSAAAPVVTGLAGWILSIDPGLSAAEVRGLIIQTAVPTPYVTHDENGHHDSYGYGIIDPIGVMDLLLSGGDIDTDQPNDDAPEDDTADTPAGAPDKSGCATTGTTTTPAVLVALALALVGIRRRPAT